MTLINNFYAERFQILRLNPVVPWLNLVMRKRTKVCSLHKLPYITKESINESIP